MTRRRRHEPARARGLRDRPDADRLQDRNRDRPRGWFGTIETLPRATPELVEHARRQCVEVPAERLLDEGATLVDSSDGRRFEVGRFHVQWPSGDPRVMAFAVRDGLLVPLVAPGGNRPIEEALYMGTMRRERIGGPR